MLKVSLQHKLERLAERREEIHALLSTPSVISDKNSFRELSKEVAEMNPIVDCFYKYKKQLQSMKDIEEILKDNDKEMRSIAEEELQQREAEVTRLETEIQKLLLPKDPADSSNTFLEIRAGTGGEEAALFAADLMRMYCRYAELKGWQVEVISTALSDLEGYKEIILRIIGRNAYSLLKFESGVHRVQRVPETESQGRIHTSACTVAVMPEADEISDIVINTDELKIDTFRASGAGGQHVNKTDSAIRITHLPTGIVIECQDERSQHKNRARAMSLLNARLLDAEQNRQQEEIATNRRSLVGSGDRSERIRTYNYPQGRITDHRINLTFYKLDEFLEGGMDMIIENLINEHQADQLATLANDME